VGEPDAKIRLADAAKNAFQGFTERIEFLCGGCGYAIETLWTMTPRQIMAFVHLFEKRFKREQEQIRENRH
jgi:hypothetical protein